MIMEEVKDGKGWLIALLDAAIATTRPNLTQAKQRQQSDGILRLVVSSQKTCTQSIIQHGFEKTGQYTGNGYSFVKKMAT